MSEEKDSISVEKAGRTRAAEVAPGASPRPAEARPAGAVGDDPPRGLPMPIIEKRRWPIALIWIVPVIALIVAGYYYRERWMERGGTAITLIVNDATGLKINESPVSHRGVPIGKIFGLEISSDQKHVLIHARLGRGNEAFARKGAIFWMVRPEVSAESVSGLTTIFSGPYIEAKPGTGEVVKEFVVQSSRPVVLGEGVRFVLRAPRRQSLTPGSPVYYHGIQVGVIEDVRLSDDAASVEIPIFIRQRYAPLVRTDSVFWAVSGADIQGGLFTGVRVRVESLRSLLAGGVSFATPTRGFGPPADRGTAFELSEEKKEWLTWSPVIALSSISTDDQEP